MLVLVVLVGIGPAAGWAAEHRVQQARSARGMVVSVSPAATRIGRDMLARGGNAVDAAVATAFALAVTWPEAGNIGGGGFMMIFPGGGRQPVCIDYRETAPGAATRDMFSFGGDRYTRKIVGVPGTVRGLALAHQKFGRLRWKTLVRPAVQLAENGFPVDRALAESINRVLAAQTAGEGSPDAELRRVYGKPGGQPWRAGDQLVLKDLAKTLRMIAERGPDVFYTGPIARQIVAEMQRGDGWITDADLAGYAAKVRKPVQGTYRGCRILGPPPPSSGGICVVEALNILENFDLQHEGRYSPRAMHVMAETMRRVFCDRARYLGDADFVSIPQRLTQKEYARRLARGIDLTAATASQTLAPEIAIAAEPRDTTHFSIIDADGMAVANTYTLESSWGSRIVVRGAGFLLNNEMGDFNWFPGRTDREGHIGTAPNQIAPHKRMLSSQSPTIVTRHGRVLLVTGSPGGRTIINTVLQVVVNVLLFKMDLAAAVEAPRQHHQWFPDQLRVERIDQRRYGDSIQKLRQMGHVVVDQPTQGSAHSIWVDPATGLYVGVADWRRGGLAAGLTDRRDCRFSCNEVSAEKP